MRTVWIINHYAQEPGGPGGTRHYSIARHLLGFGWQAHIIAASVELNTGRQRLNPGQWWRRDEIEGVPFLWLRTNRYKGNGIGRIFSMVWFAAIALLCPGVARLPRPDVIIGSSVHPFAAWAGKVLARRYGVPFIFEVRDLWPQTLIDMGRLRQDSVTAKAMRCLEGSLYRSAARVITLLPRAHEYIARFGVPGDRIVWLPNGVDLEPSTDTAVEPADAEKPFTFMYLGAHGNANALDLLLDAFALLKNAPDIPPHRLRLIGDGPLKNKLIQKAHSLELNNVSFEPAIPKHRVRQVAFEADAFVLTALDLPLYQYGISFNKLYDYMAAERPVVYACNAANNPVEEAGAGICIEPGSASSLAQALVQIMRLAPDERRAMGQRGRRYVESRHSYQALAGRLAALLDTVVEDRNDAADESNHARRRSDGKFGRGCKRAFDLIIAALLVVLTAPVMAAVAVCILACDGRPVLFRQQRPGLHGRPFTLYKFRTMSTACDANGTPLPDAARLTRLGATLRRWSLDELPQLFNVLKGDMSLVGPRPLLMEYLPLYNAEQARRHEVRPGITGWAQVNGRNATSWDEKFKLDVWYVDNQSFLLDLKILALTALKVLSREGINQEGHATAERFTGNRENS